MESKAVSMFLDIVNSDIRGDKNPNQMSEKTALKFLISRKFDLDRAVQLYKLHEITRFREGLTNIDPSDDDLKEELNSGKFTILKHRDPDQSAIALFTAKLHAPNKSSKNVAMRRKIHCTTLKGIVYQLDSAMDDVITQRQGIVFIYNMSDSDYSNFDYELCQKILNLLKGAYPARLKKVLIVSPPLWFRAPFHLLRLIVREKLRDRVWLLNIDQLSEHIPASSLTPELKGHYQHDHLAWLAECHNLHKTRLHDLADAASAENLIKTINNKPNAAQKRPSSDASGGSGYSLDTCHKENDRAKKQSKMSAYDYDDNGVTLSQFVQMIKVKEISGLGEEYENIVTFDKGGTFMVSSNHLNMRKNRYLNVMCYDHSRVVLEPYDLPEGTDNSVDQMDYINANFVDGYRQPRAYISTQGPTDLTLNDFWRMIWQTSSRVIVMVTNLNEREIEKSAMYWPTNNPMTAGIYKIDYIGADTQKDFVITHLKLTNTRSEVSRDIWHLQFLSWPDFGTPSATALLKYRENVLKKQLDAIELTGGVSYPPVVVHCSAGVGRSGTFITIDICIQKLETTGLVDVKGVVEKLREQRYSSIQTKSQYAFCYQSVFEYALSCGLLSNEDVDGLF